jgi:uncharacterized tellurite resistance protein B-like protein
MTDQVETTTSTETPVETSNEQVIKNTETAPDTNVVNEVKAEKVIEPDWSENWLDKMASDEKAKNILGRYASPKAVGEALVAAQKKISSYKPSVELPQNPTEEDIKNYRKAYNIPEDPKGYDLKLDNGLVIGNEDMPIVEKFLERAHSRHAKPNEIKAVLQDYFEVQQAQNQEMINRFEEQRVKAEDELRAEWGNGYRQNANIINNFVENKFGDQAHNILNAVLADGTLLKNNPTVVRQLLNLAQDVDPVATIGRSSSYDAESIDSEIAKIEQVMHKSPKEYFADKAMVKKYEELVTVREKLKSR